MCQGAMVLGVNVPLQLGARVSRLSTLAPWHVGTVAPWHLGTLAPWHLGTLAPWHLGTLALLRTHLVRVFRDHDEPEHLRPLGHDVADHLPGLAVRVHAC